MDNFAEHIKEATGYLAQKAFTSPRVGVILGTGLEKLAKQVDISAEWGFEEIPHFPQTTVEGHSGRLLCGILDDVPVLVMEGRLHYYEGYSLTEVTFPVRIMQGLGVEIMVVTNAAGGMNPDFSLSDLMLIEDHINFMPDNPLRGANDDSLGPRYPDMCYPYHPGLLQIAEAAANRLNLSTQRGVLVAVPGPNLETRAEYRMLRTLGADAVTMSTIPEVIVAAHAGMKTFGCSVITDLCFPESLEPVNIAKIIQVANEGGEKLTRLLREFLRSLPPTLD